LYYLTHADLRYRHPIDPIVLSLTVAALAGAWRMATGTNREGLEESRKR
jgi:hypothetical protein